MFLQRPANGSRLGGVGGRGKKWPTVTNQVGLAVVSSTGNKLFISLVVSVGRSVEGLRVRRAGREGDHHQPWPRPPGGRRRPRRRVGLPARSPLGHASSTTQTVAMWHRAVSAGLNRSNLNKQRVLSIAYTMPSTGDLRSFNMSTHASKAHSCTGVLALWQAAKDEAL